MVKQLEHSSKQPHESLPINACLPLGLFPFERWRSSDFSAWIWPLGCALNKLNADFPWWTKDQMWAKQENRFLVIVYCCKPIEISINQYTAYIVLQTMKEFLEILSELHGKCGILDEGSSTSQPAAKRRSPIPRLDKGWKSIVVLISPSLRVVEDL